MNLKVLVIGYGSIGKQHVAKLNLIGIKPYVLTSYPDDSKNALFIKSINDCKEISYIIIATPTAKHLSDFLTVAENTKCKRVFIEKPLEINLEQAEKIKKIALKNKIAVFCGYDMRHWKVFDMIKQIISKYKSEIRLVNIYVGQYLPDWRPGQDYRKSYSSKREQGGGVDLDLSHEIDYMLWLFGSPQATLFKWTGKISHLEINSPDIFMAVYKYPSFIVDVEMDYFRKINRGMDILGENEDILSINYISKEIKFLNKLISGNDLFDGRTGFINELKEFLEILPLKNLCTLDEAVSVIRWI